MARALGVKTAVDLSGLERHFKLLAAGTSERIDTAFVGLQDAAENLARRVVDAQIYDTPPRGGYDRTGALKRSIYAIRIREAPFRWQLVVGAVGGAGGRSYALFNERGTYGGRISLEQVLADAKAAGPGLIVLEYGDPESGLEPRPWTIPTVVMVHNSLPEIVLDAIRRAEAASAPRRAA